MKNLIGEKFGRLTVLNEANKKHYYTCRCDCGNKKTIIKYHLKSGSTKSCGCLQKEITAKRLIGNKYNKVHDLSSHPSYGVYAGMKDRCYNLNNKCYKYYGAKGVLVLISFKEFYKFYKEDYCAGCKIKLDHKNGKTQKTVDRLDHNGHYELNNIRIVCMSCNAKEVNSRIYVKKPSKKQIEYLFHEKRFCPRQIAENFGVGRSSVLRWFKYYDIKTRNKQQSIEVYKKPPIGENKIRDLYINNKLSITQISKITNKDRNSISSELKKYNIPIRTISENNYIRYNSNNLIDKEPKPCM